MNSPRTGIFVGNVGDCVRFPSAEEQLSVSLAWSAIMARAGRGDETPALPRGYKWRPLGELAVAELRARASDYRLMATTARGSQAVQALRRLADRFDELADQREREKSGDS